MHEKLHKNMNENMFSFTFLCIFFRSFYSGQLKLSCLTITGKNCEYNINECESTPCKNNGWCIDEVNSYKCVCQYGNTGPHCEENIDFCDPNYCMNNATCRSLDDMFVCECTQGLSGIWCEIDIDECAEDPCVNGKCLNTYGGFICECEKGFSGSLCQEEIDECLVDKYPCQNAGICVDLIGDFICECMQGFTGKQCETDVDECEVDPCGRGRCINTFGGFICECDIGYGGSLCKEEINECLVNKFPCLNFGTCVDLLGSFRCDCIPGFTGSLCDMNINECDSTPCENGGVCIDMINDFRCDCPDKFKGPLCQTEKDTLSSTATISTEMFDFTKSPYAKTTISHVDMNTTTAEYINTTDPHGIRNYTYHDSSSVELATSTSEHTTVKNLPTSSMGSTKILNQTILASFVTQSSEMKNVTVIATVANIKFKEDNVTHPLPFTSLPLAENTETSLATSTDTTTVYSHKPVDSVKENITTIAPTIAYSSSFVTQTTNPVTTKFDRITSAERLTVTKTAIANISTTESMITTFDQMPSIHSTTMSPKRVYLPSTSRVINDTTKDTESLTVTQPFGTFETSTTVDLTQADTSMRGDSSGEKEILSSGDHFLISSGDQRGSGEDITLFTSHDASGEDVDKLTFIKDSSSGDDIPASQNKEEISMYSASREEDMQITEITEYRFDHSGEEEIPLSGDQMFVSSGDKTVIREYETDTFVSTTSGDEALSISDSEDLSEYSSGDTGISSSGDTVLPTSADQNVTREHETEHNVSTASGDIDITSSGSEDLAEYSSGDAGIYSSGDQISPSSVGQNETSKHEIDPFVPTTSGDRDITSSGSEELSEYSSGDAGLYSSGDQILSSSAGQNETTKLKMDPFVPTASGEIDITSSGSEDLAEYSSGDTGISSSGDLVLPSSADQNETSKYVIDLLVISASGEVDITSSGSEDLSEYSSGDAEISSSGDRVLPTSVESDISEYETKSVVFTASGDVDFTSSGSGDLYEYSSGEKEISSSGAQVLSSGDQKEKSKHETFFIHSESLEDDEIASGYIDYLGTSRRTNVDYSTTPETLPSYISIEQSILSGDGELFYKNNTDHHVSTSSADGDLSSSGSEGVSEYSTGDIEVSSSGDQLFSSSGDQNVIEEHETVTFVSTASGVEDLSSSGNEGVSEYSSSGVEISSSGDQLFSSSGDQNVISEHETVILISTASGDEDLSSSGSEGISEYSSSGVEISTSGDQLFSSSGDQNVISEHETVTLISTASGDEDLSSSGGEGVLEYSSSGIEISSPGDHIFPSSGDKNELSKHVRVPLVSTVSGDEDLSSSSGENVLEYSSSDKEISSSGDQIFPSSGDQNELSKHVTVPFESTASGDGDLSSSGSAGVFEYSSSEISSSGDKIFPSSGDQSVLKEYEANSIITSVSGDYDIVDRDSKDVLKYNSGESEIWSSAEHVIFSSGEQTTLSEDDMLLQKHETSGEMEISSGFENQLSISTHTTRKLDFTSLVTEKSIVSSGELSIFTSSGDGDLVSSGLYYTVIPKDDLETPANNKTNTLYSTPLPVNESSGDSLPEIPAYESSGGGIQPVELDSLDYHGAISSGDAMKVIDDHTTISIEQSSITQHAILNVNTNTLRSIMPNKSLETTDGPSHQYKTITEEPGSKTTPVSGKYLIWVEVNDIVPGDNQKSFINYTEYNIISSGDRDELSLALTSENDYDDLLRKNVNKTNLKSPDSKEDTVDWESSGNIVSTTDSTADMLKPSSHPSLLSTQHATDVHESVDKTFDSEKFIDGSGEYNTSGDISSSGDDISKDTDEIVIKREISVISDDKLTNIHVNATTAFLNTSQTTIQELFTKLSGTTGLPNTATEMQVSVAEHQIVNMSTPRFKEIESLFNTTIKWTNITADSNMGEANTSAIILTNHSSDDDSLKRIHSPTKGLVTATSHESTTSESITTTHLMSSANYAKKNIYRPNNPWLFASKHLHQKGKQAFKPSNPWLAARMHLQKIHQKKKKHKDSKLRDKTQVSPTPVASVLQQITEIIKDKSKSSISSDISSKDTTSYSSESSELNINITKHYNVSLFTSSVSSMLPTTDHMFPDILAVNDSEFKGVSADTGFEIPSVTTALHPSTDTQTTSLTSTLTTDYTPISKILETKSMENITDIPNVVPSAKHTTKALQIETTQSKQSSEASTHAQPSVLDLHSTKPVSSKTVTKEHKSAESLEPSRDISDVVTPREYETTLGLKTKTYIERNKTILSQSISTPPPPIIPTLIVYYPTEDQSVVSFSSKVETKKQQRTDSSPEIDTLPDVTYPSTSVSTVSTLNNTNLTAEWFNKKTQAPETSEHTKLKTTVPVYLPTNLTSLSEPPSSFTVSHDCKFKSSTPISFLNATSAASVLTLPNVTSSISSCRNQTKSNESQIFIKPKQESKLRNFTDFANLIYSIGPVSTDLFTSAISQNTTLPATTVKTHKSTAPLTSVKITKPETTINLEEGEKAVSSLPESELPRTEAKQTFFRTSQHVFQSHLSSPISTSTSFATPDTASVVFFNKTNAKNTTGNMSVILGSTTAASNYSTVFTDLKQSTWNIKQPLVTDMTQSTLGETEPTSDDKKCTKWKQIWGRFKICIQHGQLLSTKETNTEMFSTIRKGFKTSTVANINELMTEREVTMKSSAFVLTNDTSSPEFTFRPTSTLQSSISSTPTTPLWQSQRNFTFNYTEASSVNQITEQSPEITTSKYLPSKHTLLVTQPSNFTHNVTLQPINLTGIHNTMSKTPVFQSTSGFSKIKSNDTSFIMDTILTSSRHKTAMQSTSSPFTRTIFTTIPTYTMPSNISTVATQPASPIIRSHNVTSLSSKTPYTSNLTISNLIPRSTFVSSTNITKLSAIETSTSPTSFTSQSLLPVSSSRAKFTHSTENPNILRINTTDLITPTEPISVVIPRMDLSQEHALTPNITFPKNMKSTTDRSTLTLPSAPSRSLPAHLLVLPVTDRTSSTDSSIKTTTTSPLSVSSAVSFSHHSTTDSIIVTNRILSMGNTTTKNTTSPAIDTRSSIPSKHPTGFPTTGTENTVGTSTTKPVIGVNVDTVSVPMEIRMNASAATTVPNLTINNKATRYTDILTLDTSTKMVKSSTVTPRVSYNSSIGTSEPSKMLSIPTKPCASISSNMHFTNKYDQVTPLNMHSKSLTKHLTSTDQTLPSKEVFSRTHLQFTSTPVPLPFPKENDWATNITMRLQTFPLQTIKMQSTGSTSYKTTTKPKLQLITLLTKGVDRTVASENLIRVTDSENGPLTSVKQLAHTSTMSVEPLTSTSTTSEEQSPRISTTTAHQSPSIATTTAHQSPSIATTTAHQSPSIATTTAHQSPRITTTTAHQSPRISTTTAQQLPIISTTSAEQLPSISTTTAQKLPSISTTTAHQSPSISTTIAQQLPSISTTTAHQSPSISTTIAQQLPSSSTTTAQQSPSHPTTTTQQLPSISTATAHQSQSISTTTAHQSQSISTATAHQSQSISTATAHQSQSISTTTTQQLPRISTTSVEQSSRTLTTSNKPSLSSSVTSEKQLPNISTIAEHKLPRISTTSVESLLSISTTSDKPSLRVSTTSDKSSLSVSTTSDKPSLSVSTTSDKPSLSVSTTSDKPSLSVSTTSDKPSLSVSTTSDKSSLSVSTTSDKPSLRFSTTTMKPSPSISTASMEPLQNISTKSIEHLSSTRKLSVIRHIVDLTSNNTYPHPRKEVSEYIRNTTIVKKKAVLTFKLIKVTVVRTVSQVAESGRKIVLQSYRRVKDIATTLTVTTYSRAKQLLKKALNRVGALWKYCKTGINHFVVKPLLNARVFVKHRFHRAYARLGELFQRGRQIFDTTIDTFKDETASYFENLANYYTGVYTQYTSEVKDIFESLKIPDSDPS